MDIYSKNPETDVVKLSEEVIKEETSDRLTPDEKLKRLEELFGTQRKTWLIKITSLIKKIKDVNELSDAQALMLSYRQILVEILIKTRIRIRKSKTNYERQYKERYMYYTKDYDLKLRDRSKTEIINADLYFLRASMDILEIHVEFLKESIATLDKMAFAIKNRISFEEL